MDTTRNWALRPMKREELDALYEKRMQLDFPSAERPNLAAMRRHVDENLQSIWILQDEDEDAAYVVCAEANGLVLVTLLAVFAERRGGGTGSALLELLAEKYYNKRAILLEVEDPLDAEDEADHAIRTRRIGFYERNGYQFLDGVRHDSFGVHLLVMALPLEDTLENVRKNAVTDLQAIYHKVLPMALWDRVTTQEE